MEKICRGCGEKFQCLGNEECWCHLIKIKDATRTRLKSLSDDCFCEKCLLLK